MEAYVTGVSTRSVDDLVAALGVDSGISEPSWWGAASICEPADEGAQCGAPSPAMSTPRAGRKDDGPCLHAQFVGGELARERVER